MSALKKVQGQKTAEFCFAIDFPPPNPDNYRDRQRWTFYAEIIVLNLKNNRFPNKIPDSILNKWKPNFLE